MLMDPEDGFTKRPQNDVPLVHKYKSAGLRSSPHASEAGSSSTSGADSARTQQQAMRKDDEQQESSEGCASDWLTGGPLGSKGAVLVFRSCVLASKSPSIESTSTKNVGNNTGNSILLNKAKNMAKRLTHDPQSHTVNIRSKNIMHDVMETFGHTNKFLGNAIVVRHVSDAEIPSTVSIEEQGHESHDIPEPATEHKRDIDDVLNDLSKITLKKHLNIENTTANIKPADEKPPPKGPLKLEKHKGKHRHKSKKNANSGASSLRGFSPGADLQSSDSDMQLVKESDVVKVPESTLMPARALCITYRLVNTETKLLHRLLQAHGLEEVADDRSCNLLWSGLHPKPDVLRGLSPYQRVNHFPRSYELTRKDKLYKNIEKMQYFRGLKHFDFIPTTFLMPAEYKELCTTHYRTKGPWIVKPAASSRGRGIYIVNTPEQIPKGENVVVAKYIDKPLLIGGHKCDLRLYVCVSSIDPLLIYLYEEGLVRFATVKYDKTNKNLWNPCMHLCNYSINKYHTDYIKCDDPNAGNVGHKWTLSALLRHLRKQGRDTTALMTAIEDLVVKSVLSCAQTMTAAARAFVPNFFNCFELFGYDILVDDMLKPWLLEINLSPSLACDSPLDARVKSALLADTLTLVGIPAVPLMNKDPPPSSSLKMRIGACRRVYSAEALGRGAGAAGSSAGAGGAGGGGAGAGGGGPLSGEERRLVRAARQQFARRGGYVRIFPSPCSWQKYSQYLDPVSGVPVCSTSLNNNAPYCVVAHNYNLLLHAHVLPHCRHAAVTQTPPRMSRYEAGVTSPPVSLGEAAAVSPRDSRRARELVKHHLTAGLKLTLGESRRAFGLYLTLVLKRLSSSHADAQAPHAAMLLKFLKRACSTLRMPYHVKSPPPKMCDKDKCAVIAKLLNDFLYMYYRETDLYTDSEDKDGCVPNMHFSQFLVSASEADLEDVIMLVLRLNNWVTPFLGDTRNVFCIDLPPSKLGIGSENGRHVLLKHLAYVSPINMRKHNFLAFKIPEYEPVPPAASAEPEDPPTRLPFTDSDIILKESLKEEKPLNMALKYARS